MIAGLIKKTAADFGLVSITAADNLDDVRLTAFSWTNTPGALCLAANKKYYQQACRNENVAAIVAPPAAVLGIGHSKPEVIVDKASEFFYFIHNMALHKIAGLPDNFIKHRIAASASIAPTAIIGEHVDIGENVCIDHGCIVLDNTVIGDDTAIGPKCVLGVEGFFSKYVKGRKIHLQHYGGVRIGRNCKFHSDITVSRSANYAEYTEIGDNVHIGHKSIIGHDCKISQGTDISAGVLISGRVKIESGCWIGASASISNACKVGIGASVRIGAVVVSDVPAGAEVSGNFAIDHRNNLIRYLKERSR